MDRLRDKRIVYVEDVEYGGGYPVAYDPYVCVVVRKRQPSSWDYDMLPFWLGLLALATGLAAAR